MLKSDHDNLNIKAAYLHVPHRFIWFHYCYTFGSQYLFSGMVMVDPLASMILSMLVLKSGIGAFRLALKHLKN